MICQWCQEPATLEECNHKTPLLEMHHACGFRSIMGSLAHLQGRCSCYVAGSTYEDPPGMSRRRAAMAALAYWLTLSDEEREAVITRPKLVKAQ